MKKYEFLSYKTSDRQIIDYVVFNIENNYGYFLCIPLCTGMAKPIARSEEWLGKWMHKSSSRYPVFNYYKERN